MNAQYRLLTVALGLLVVPTMTFSVNHKAANANAPKQKPATIAVQQTVAPAETPASTQTTSTSLNPQSGEQIKWQVISGGGNKGTSTSFILSGTIGQTAVGTGASTSYKLNQGFWQNFGSSGCCLPGPTSWRGDIDQSGGNPALADLSKLISYLKNQPGHYVYPCADQANVDALPASNSNPSLADLSKLISYLKNQPGHWVLLPCP